MKPVSTGNPPPWTRRPLVSSHFGDTTSARSIWTFLACLAITQITLAAAELQPWTAKELVGRWESSSFVTTNYLVGTNYVMLATNREFLAIGGVENRWTSANLVATNSSRQTNLILCVYEVSGEGLDRTTRKRWAYLDTELHFIDHTGKEKPIREASGLAFLTERHIEFAALYGYIFSHSLTNGVMTLDKLGCFGYDDGYYIVRVKTTLKKVNSEPGERLSIWRAEPGPANTSQPHE